MMAADTMEALGIKRGDYVVKVNNRKVLDGVLESIGLGGEENAGRRLTVLRAMDKYDRLGREGVRALLGEGRKDESGDFTKGAGLNDEQITSLLGFAAPGDYVMQTDIRRVNFKKAMLPVWRLVEDGGSIADDQFQNAPPKEESGFPGGETFLDPYVLLARWRDMVASSRLGCDGVDEVVQIFDLVRAAGYGTRRIEVSSSVVRGLEYYTGPVFEVELTFPIEDEDGKPVRFGSVGGGGRYDGLVARFRGEQVPATGFSIGVSRLLAALKHLGKIEDKPAPGPVVVTVFDRDRVADYQRMVQQLRDAPLVPDKPDGPRIRAELYLGNPKNIPNQFKYADRRHSPCVIIQGGDEKNNPAGPQVVVKDLILGSELSKLETGRDAHLQRQAEAQRLVPEDQLVDAVRAVLARHGLTWE
jgi:histidyl-tRNA synthetase